VPELKPGRRAAGDEQRAQLLEARARVAQLELEVARLEERHGVTFSAEKVTHDFITCPACGGRSVVSLLYDEPG
jgi:hypothetical protein